MNRIAYGCCIGSEDKFRQYVLPRVQGRPWLGLGGQESIAQAYNSILDAYAGRGLEALVLLHDDLEILNQAEAEATFLAAVAEPDVALVGVAGGRNVFDLAWWEAETVGHQLTATGPLDFGERTGDVESLEGSILVFSAWAIDNLRFDERYGGWHSYDSISMDALDAGKRVVVADVDTFHHTSLGFRSEASAQQWHAGNARFRATWGTFLERRHA